MQHDMDLIHGDLKDFVINDELESTMPMWTESDPASLEADFPPEPKWVVPQQLYCELPFLVRPRATVEHRLFSGENEESAWTVFQRVHPQTLGLFAFSRPSFSRDGNLALVYWTFYPSGMALLGDVGFSRLVRVQSEWHVVEWHKESIADLVIGPCTKQL